MSDRDFENYLTLLSSLLRLDRKQRQSIAEELRSHLEDRLDDLTARGVPHDKAIKQALAEFGDAAGLAGQFVAISHNRKRRWLMRLTTFSIAATLLIAAGLALLWPARNAAPGAAELVAQETNPADQPPTPQNRPPIEPALEEKLNLRLDVDFVETPLQDVIAYLQEHTGIQFVIRTKKLEEISRSPDMPVSKALKRVRVSTLLELLLDDLELTYVDKDDLILITTPEDAEATQQIRVYDCRDLLAMPAPPGADKFITPPARSTVGGMFAVDDKIATPSSAPASQPQPNPQRGGGSDSARPISEHDLKAEHLMEIIEGNVDMNTWDTVGGPGSISEYNGLIVVTQTAKTHKKVERILDMLREAAGLEVPKSGKVVR